MRRGQFLLHAKTLLLVLRHGELKDIALEFARRIYSNDESYVLRRDLSGALTHPAPKIPIALRPMREADLVPILRERPRRFPVLEAEVPTCYVATAEDGSLCYMQWLIESSQQERLRPFFKGDLWTLKADEVLLEFAYTFERFRGKGVMGAAMAQIAEQNPNARWALTYVQRDNIASLKGCRSAGFRPYMIRHERWRLFRLTQRFTLLPLGALYPWEEQAASAPACIAAEPPPASAPAAASPPSPASAQVPATRLAKG